MSAGLTYEMTTLRTKTNFGLSFFLETPQFREKLVMDWACGIVNVTMCKVCQQTTFHAIFYVKYNWYILVVFCLSPGAFHS